MALLERLSTDRSIAPLVAQFVPLKVETDGPDWQKWASKHRHEGSGIPILYVIRADGEMIYGKSGSKEGAELPQFLNASLSSAGRILSDQQVVALKSAVDDANKAISEGDTSTAVKRLAILNKFEPPGKVGSHAAVAIEADSLYAKLVEQGQAALKAAQEKLAGDDKFAGVLEVIAADRIYGTLPDLKKDLVSAERDMNKDAQLKELVKPAEALDRALALASNKNGAKQAVPALQLVITRYANSPAAELAKEKLSELGGAVPEVPATAAITPAAAAEPGSSAGLRTWSDATGQYKIEAELISVSADSVQLKRKDGKVITVPLAKLSQQDRDIATQR